MNTHNTQEDFELIESYLNGSLGAEGQEEIRLRLLSDANFAAKVEEIRQLKLGVERAALASKLDSFHVGLSDQRKPHKVRKISSYQILGVAASFSLLVCVAIWWLVGRASPGEALYQSYYQADPGLVTTMSGDSDYDFDRAMVDFKSGEYLKAKEAFESLLSKNSENDTLTYFLAMAELNLDGEQAAEKLLLKVSQDSTSGFSKDSFWYLGLLALKNEDYDLAKEYLERSGRSKAGELIQAIERAVK
jgi:tetratricopeptide (TPR) repeat protein